MDSPERRIFKRVKGVFRVTLRVNVNIMFEFICISKDISEGGMRLVVERKILPGTDVSVKFMLPHHVGDLEIGGEVVWVNPSMTEEGEYETGIKFTMLDPRQRAILRQYVRER